MRNGSAVAKSVFDDFRGSLPIDKRHVKAHFGQAASRFTGKEFFGRAVDALHLSGREAFSGTRKTSALLHFDKNQGSPIAQDQVNLSGAATPAAARDGKAASFVVLRDPIFGCDPGMIGHAASLALGKS